MNESKKFVIKKTNSLLRAKIASSDELQFQLQNSHIQTNVQPEGAQSFAIENIIFTARDQKIIKKQASHRFENELFMARYSPDDNKIANTFLDGSVSIINARDQNKTTSLSLNPGTPITAVAWKDGKSLLLGDTEGIIYDLEYTKSGGDLQLSSRTSDPSEQILTIEYCPQLSTIAYAGKTAKITLLSDQTKKPIKVYEPGDSFSHGHTNRVFSIKFFENAPQTFISAGWDGTMFLWDIRTQRAVNSVFGPVLSGDALDIKDNMILAGSYRDKDSLELYDVRLFKKICNIDWNLSGDKFNYVSSCRFNKNKAAGDLVIAGSCLANQVGIFKKDIVYNQELLVSGVKKGVYSVGFALTENKFFFASNDGELNLYHYFNM